MIKVRVERDVSTGEWIVVEVERHGWSVVLRTTDYSEAQCYAARLRRLQRGGR